MKTPIKNLLIACTLLITFISQAQTGSPSTEPARVSFTVKNPTMKNKIIDFKSYDNQSKMIAAYGYGLNAFASHATNMPVPTYVYEEKDGKKELLFVVTKEDDGKTFSVTQKYEITREQYLDAANGEMKLKNAEKTKEDNSIQGVAKKKGIKLVGVNIKGSSLFPSMAHVRYELPWGSDKQVGFSSSLSKLKGRYEFLPAGTKVYQCSDKFWSKSTKFTEKLILTVDESKDELSVSLQ
ncbi:MAG: hypothetical protein MUF58_00675 [Arcicella sp.]|jgi:hypothetical protein|nr:hypothetical protein [Arcicella sp.]